VKKNEVHGADLLKERMQQFASTWVPSLLSMHLQECTKGGRMMASPDQQKKCPDCGNDNMIDGGERFDVFSGQNKKTKKCSQCRRWIYDG